MEILRGMIGLLGFVFLAFLMSENKRKVRIKPIVFGLVLQIVIAVILSKVKIVIVFFEWINRAVIALSHATIAGTSFVFGYVGGGTVPFQLNAQGSAHLFSLAFMAMPMVIVIAAISGVLFYWRILPRVIHGLSWVLRRTLGIGGPLATGISSNLFVGMCESPFIIKPYLKKMTRNEIFTMMTCGMAGVAGTVMALYVTILAPVIPDVMVHVISAVIISVPAIIMISGIIIPESESITLGDQLNLHKSLNVLDALTQGVKQGVEVFVSIIAMLIVLIALVAFVNKLLELLPFINGHAISLKWLLGYAFMPFMWLMGVPWHEALTAGQLMGERMVLNELVSFQSLASLPKGALDPRVSLMMMYAMCGFANFSGLGIMMAGYGTLAPNRRREIVKIGFKTMIAGTICTCMSATVIGMIY